MQCPRCQHDAPSDAAFCPECGTPLKRTSEAGRPGASDAELQRALAEALEQQTATAEILKVISRSAFELQPVLETLLENATRLCRAEWGVIFRPDGDAYRGAVVYGASPEFKEFVARTPIPPGRGSTVGRAALERRTVQIADVTADPEYQVTEFQKIGGFRTVLAVPMLREGVLLGVFGLHRDEVRPFTEKQIQLVTTFADQAVIAIENVRLFTELQEKNHALTLAHGQVTQALEQQTATAEILRMISGSPTDVQPVFDVIVERAVRLCGARFGRVYRYDGSMIHMVAGYGLGAAGLGVVQQVFPRPASDDTIVGRVILTRQPALIRDIEREERVPALSRRMIEALETRSQVTIPMLRTREPIGAMTLGWAEPDAFDEQQIALLNTFADQAVIAIENVRLFKELESKNRDLTETLQQQTATGDILSVIASSPTDIQPVFAAVAASANRLCDALDATIFQIDGELLRVAVHNGPIASHPVGDGPSLTRETPSGRAVLDRRTIHVADTQAEIEEYPEGSRHARRLGFRTVLAVPLMREGAAIGVINLRRTEARLFTDQQVVLLKTFADHAVIAIENVRLFKELEARNRDLTEALDQQTATAEILRVISTSPTDLQPVLDTVVKSAARFCGAYDASMFRLDAETLRVAAHHGPIPHPVGRLIPVIRGTISGRAVLERRAVHVTDIQAEVEGFPEGQALAHEHGWRTILSVPLLREGAAMGTIVLRRAEMNPFTDKQIALLHTFADQAVIAIENVRLFTELQEKNRALTEAHAQVIEALEQQTATSEILRVISQSPTDTQPVFDAIVERALRLSEATVGAVAIFDGELIHVVASNLRPDSPILRVFPMRPSRTGSLAARTVFERQIIHVPDALAEPEYNVSQQAAESGYRSVLSVPMLRDGTVVGTITLGRSQAGPYLDRQIALLQTFADQAVIAIENVRLFKELETRNKQLTEALEQQIVTSEILRVISSSPTDIQPVLDTVVESAVRLCGAERAVIFRFDGKLLRAAASYNVGAELRQFVDQNPIALGQHSISARAGLERRTVHIPDLQADPASAYAMRDVQPIRTMLAVPMLKGDDLVGTITIYRLETHPFTDKQVALVETFADQAVIAIENVRLFNETKEALERQMATSEILGVISGSPTDVQPVFDVIAESAARLCDGIFGAVYRLDGDTVHMVAHHNLSPEGWAAYQALYPRPLNRQTNSGRAMLEGRVAITEDVEADTERSAATREAARLMGLRSAVTVPLRGRERTIGALTVGRDKPGTFTTKQIALLQTFADQAVIAIENVRLFKELETRTGELTRSVGELTALGEVSQALSSTLDIETVLDTIVSRASQLVGDAGCSIYAYDEATEHFELRATHHYDADFVDALRAAPLRKGEGVMGRAAEMREPIQIPDITQPGAYQSSVRDTLIRFGYRALLSVPLLREDQIIGSLSFNRKAPGEFPPEVVDVLKTFATQSALAIQNARLFLEIADKSQQLEAASRHKSEFLANMSHELRTPLNAIIGFSEVLMQRMFGELNTKQEEYLKDIYESGRHLLSLINDILDLSKIEAGRMELELTEFDLPTAIESALTLVHERATRRGIALQKTLDERIGRVQADERKVRQVVLNLLSNAIKFTPEGGRIEVRAVPVDGSIEVSVADTGVGIAPEDQEAVFEEFRQVGSSAAKQEGTGLGLALCRKFVELHGGTIWVTSAVGAGSTFTFRLPVRP